jgi:hypothetical protein
MNPDKIRKIVQEEIAKHRAEEHLPGGCRRNAAPARERKVLRVKATRNNENIRYTQFIRFHTMSLQIVEQSHRGKEFGYNGSNEFTSKNGITIRSIDIPWCEQNSDTLYVRGASTDYDNDTMHVYPEYVPKILAAVDEYNAYFGGKETETQPEPKSKLFPWKEGDIAEYKGELITLSDSHIKQASFLEQLSIPTDEQMTVTVGDVEIRAWMDYDDDLCVRYDNLRVEYDEEINECEGMIALLDHANVPIMSYDQILRIETWREEKGK